MKYVVVGKCSGKKVYWNDIDVGWYCNINDATVYHDADSADSASIHAELTISIVCVDDITFKKIK